MNRVVLACLAGLAALPAFAEVGIATSNGTQVPYILAQITDDSDPWGGAWQRYGYDLNRHVLNEDGFENGDGKPSLLTLSDGRILAAWARNSASGYDVVTSVFAGGAWAAPQALAASAENEVDPALALTPGGTVHLVYAIEGPDARIVHRQAPADLAWWSGETRVSPPGQPARRPTAAWDGQTLRVAYEVEDFGPGQIPRSIAVARLDASVFQSEVVAVSYWTGDLQPRIHFDAGRVWLDWVDAENEVAWTRLDGEGTWESLRYEPYEDPPDGEFHVRPGLRTSAVAP